MAANNAQIIIFQLIQIPIRDWNEVPQSSEEVLNEFQLIQIPIRDWNVTPVVNRILDPYISINTNPYQGLKPGIAMHPKLGKIFQLIQIPIRDWNISQIPVLIDDTDFN